MKRLLLSLLVCLIVACSALAQRTPDTIYLKNGSILYGQIIEELAGGQVKIRLSDGSLLICYHVPPPFVKTNNCSYDTK